MDGGRTTERQYSYDQDTDLHQRESMKIEENKFLDKQCNPIYFQGVRTIMKSDSTGPQRFGQPWPDGPDVGGLHRFTNTAVPRTGCWQQHLLVFHAITKSNGWSPATASLQLFAPLDGEALQVALSQN